MNRLHDYEKFLIVDLEATCCDKGTIDKYQMETIEIGAVMVDEISYQIIDEYQTFIKPVRNPVLTKFCSELTSISQCDVDSAPIFSEAVSHFKKWLYRCRAFAFCSWGDYDRNQLEKDCLFHDVSYPISAEHFNIKKEFSKKQGLKKKLGMAQALMHVGIPLVGTHHRGIDDARNMARLMEYIVS